MKCPKCKKRMKKIAKKYTQYSYDISTALKIVNKPVYRCMWCGEMKYGV